MKSLELAYGNFYIPSMSKTDCNKARKTAKQYVFSGKIILFTWTSRLTFYHLLKIGGAGLPTLDVVTSSRALSDQISAI